MVRALSIFLTSSLAISVFAQPPIGQWRDHLPYQEVDLAVEGNGTVYCATRNAIFSVNASSNEIGRINKSNALSDVDISALAWHPAMGALLVGYGNGNLDVVIGETTINLSDIKRSTLIGDKRIYTIFCEGDLAYLGCGFGIVVMDLARREVKDTWIIFPNAAYHQVNGIAIYQDSIYAATELGLFSAWRNEVNLAAFNSWHRRLDVPQPNGVFTEVDVFADRLFLNWNGVGEKDTIYYWDGAWQRLSDAYNSNIQYVGVSPDGSRLVLAMTYSVRQYNTQLQQVFNVASADGEFLLMNSAAGSADGGAWACTYNTGLAHCRPDGSADLVSPNGPRNAGAYRVDVQQGRVMVATGAVSGNWSNTYSHQGLHFFADGYWRTVQEADDPLMTGVNGFGGGAVDPMAVVVDPGDPAHGYSGSWEEGVLEWRDGVVQTIWNATNSSLGTSGDPSVGVVYVGGLDFDQNGNLWVSNANTDECISVRKTDGSWKSYNPGGLLGSNLLIADIVAMENGQKWIVRPRGNGLLVFSDGGTIDDTGDDQYKLLNNFENQGKLPTLEVACVAEDHDNEIWVGTGKGVAVFYNADLMFTGENFDCQQILIEQDGNTQILLETETVTAIAVDGGNRKWLGTQTSGAFLVSEDGTQQIAHFSAENSPLPSNNITNIAIDGTTGEVFFATEQGIMGYRGEATEGGSEATCASVFPNPVRETYQGPVAITGLVADSDVRITDIAGNLVYRTISTGGQAIWPATDLSGQRVATGVYMVLASDPSGTAHCNTRVLVVR